MGLITKMFATLTDIRKTYSDHSDSLESWGGRYDSEALARAEMDAVDQYLWSNYQVGVESVRAEDETLDG